MLVVITDTGRVEQRVVELPATASDAAIAELRTTLNQRLRDRPLAEAPQIVADLPGTVPAHLRGLMTTLTAVPARGAGSNVTETGSCWAAPPT